MSPTGDVPRVLRHRQSQLGVAVARPTGGPSGEFIHPQDGASAREEAVVAATRPLPPAVAECNCSVAHERPDDASIVATWKIRQIVRSVWSWGVSFQPAVCAARGRESCG